MVSTSDGMATPPATVSRRITGDYLNYTDGHAQSQELPNQMSPLVDGARSLGIELGTAQLAQLDQLGAALREANTRVNLTRITDPAEIETRHFLDSLQPRCRSSSGSRPATSCG